jgi:hypothetical protein
MIDLGKTIFEALFSKENKDKFIDELNKKINIPIIGEQAERKIIANIFEIVESVIKGMMVKDSDG